MEAHGSHGCQRSAAAAVPVTPSMAENPQADSPELILELTPAQAAIVCGALWRERRKALRDKDSLVRKYGAGADTASQDARFAVAHRLHKRLARWLLDHPAPGWHTPPAGTNSTALGSGHANGVSGPQRGSQGRTEAMAEIEVLRDRTGI
jgi:hypothetical protein